MRKKSVIISLMLLAIFTMFNISSYGQSQQDLTLARQYAKSMGYSDTQIDQLISSYGSGSTGGISPSETTTFEIDSVDRNAVDGNKEVSKSKIDATSDQDSSQNSVKSPTDKDVSNKIYGHNIFSVKDLDFVPNYNIPTPANYMLSAGDEVIIDVWGDVITNITAKISPEGSIVIPNLGPIYLAGQSVESAERAIRAGLGRIYSQVSDSPSTTHVKVSLGATRSVTVNVVGDVARPGSYTLPSLSTLATAMYMSGGPSDIGSVRSINLYRGNKLLTTFDVYEFLNRGIDSGNVRLEDNDIISVAPYMGIVTVEGGVKRPMRYETKNGDRLDSILGYAGGFSHSAFTGSVVVDRLSASDDITGATARTFIVESKDFGSFELVGGDRVIVKENISRFVNRVNISGAVWREGSYAIGENTNQASNLYELFVLAGGLRDDAYLKRGYIERYGQGRVLEQISFSPEDIILKRSDIKLMADDSVRVVTIDEVTTKPTVLITGEVNSPSSYRHRNNMTVGDLIVMAGGITDGATLSRVEIARRKVDGMEQVESDKTSIVIELDLLKNPDAAETILMPYDMVFVRKSINYQPQMSISVNGKVNYPGTYVIESNTVRLSDVIAKAGGLSRDAYIHGASLRRLIDDESLDVIEISQDIAEEMSKKNSSESIAEIEERLGRVAIDLQKAIDNPGSIDDLVLKEGDIVNIPQFDNTVSVTGAVMQPNSVIYGDNYNVKDYVSSAGGFKKRAMKKRLYVIHMNGSIAKRGDSDFVITPGSTVIVPTKPERQGSLATTVAATASLSTVLIAVLGLIF